MDKKEKNPATADNQETLDFLTGMLDDATHCGDAQEDQTGEKAGK
ncbi:hypothetical protein [uncultured Alistipes sp.]|jgi:hypothetical protein|nr:hypothetical protein [uncultured Alistipes sp.]